MTRRIEEQNEKRKPVWPAGKAIPKFKTPAAEYRFWERYEFGFLSKDDGWEEVIGPKPTKPSPEQRRSARR